MKKKVIGYLICAVMAVSLLAGCASSGSGSSAGASGTDAGESPAADDPEVVLTMAEVNPENTIAGQMDKKFCDEVKRLSGGSVTIKLETSGVLGTDKAVLNGMMNGDDKVDIARISAFALGEYGCTKATLLSLPYTFGSRDHFWKFAESDLAQEFLQEPQEMGLGLQGLFYGEEGFRHFFTVNPISGIEDLRGLKIRVSSDKIMSGLIEGLGATPVDYDFTELYSALQTGILDGAEQPLVNYSTNEFDKIAKYLILDGHTLGAVQVVITDHAMDKLMDDQKEALKEAGKIASAYNREISLDEEREVLDVLDQEGVHVIMVEDRTPWKEAAQAVIEENLGDHKDLYEKILDMQ